MKPLSISNEAQAVALLRERLCCEQLTPDMWLTAIEGETNLVEAITAALKQFRDDEAYITGVADYLRELEQMVERRRSRIERTRSAVLAALEIAGLKSLPTVAGTASLKAVPPSVIVADENAIPFDFLRPQPPKVDRKALAEALKAGAQIPGAQLSNGGITLAIR